MLLMAYVSFSTREVVVETISLRKLKNMCKSVVEIDASQLYPPFICQPMLTGL